MKDNTPDLSPFQLRNIELLTYLYQHDAVSDEVVELLRLSELDYFSLIEKYKILEQKINLDEKTNILKFKKDYLTNIIKTASRIYHGIQDTTYPISLIRFDIDDFSIFNNKYGHALGDEVLIEFASILKKNGRPTDYIIRFGGEEFDVLLPSTPLDGAEVYINKIYDKTRNLRIKHNNEMLKITVSAGITGMNYTFSDSKIIIDSEVDDQFKQLQNEADDALYEAKNKGKDRYCIYSASKKESYSKIREEYTNSK